MPFYLGLDASTQSLTAVVIEADPRRPGEWRRAWDDALGYDEALPEFGTTGGRLPNGDPLVAHAPPAMWKAALDLMMARIAKSGLDLSQIAGISGAGQQHGSVYLDSAGDFTRDVSPIWLDSSSTQECREIETAVGGPERLARVTGSRAFERFTAAQIRKFWKDDPAAYDRTATVHLVSSFMASLLIGQNAPLEPGDAAGMNLMELASSRWWQPALDATAPDLARRLPRIVPPHTVIGTLSPYWQTQYGLPPAPVAAWTGDNPSSLIGSGLVREGQIAISLGTSDTIFGPMREPRVSETGEGHVFGAPTGEFMAITVFANGSLAREKVRDMFGLDWKEFSGMLEDRRPEGLRYHPLLRYPMLLPWFEPEITPHVTTPGIARHELAEDDAPGHVRAIVEAQMMAMAIHSRWMGVTPKTIRATGGGSANDAILQVMADVFGVPVTRASETNTAAPGAALRALHATASASGQRIEWHAVVEGIDKDTAVLRPDPHAHAIYEQLMPQYEAFEKRMLNAPPAHRAG